ncbi:hypothetical protein P3T35_000013 [Kitasatospora sp. GP30]|nr:hypothetical protein [Kitasatospora sp. GP30]
MDLGAGMNASGAWTAKAWERSQADLASRPGHRNRPQLTSEQGGRTGLDPADLPAGEGEGLAGGGDGDGALAHAGEGGEGVVGAGEDQVFVDLVGDHQQVVLDGELGDG